MLSTLSPKNSLSPLARSWLFVNQQNGFTQGGHPMEERHAIRSAQAIALAFVGGAIAGAIAGVLLAPRSGEETRRAIKGYARRTEEDLLAKAAELRADLDEVIARGKEFVEEKKAAVEAAFEAGKETFKRDFGK
jgi:gas vesicle protein